MTAMIKACNGPSIRSSGETESVLAQESRHQPEEEVKWLVQVISLLFTDHKEFLLLVHAIREIALETNQ